MKVYIEKLYSVLRNDEHLSLCVPFKKGKLKNVKRIRVLDGERCLPVQAKATSLYEDGSVKYAFVRFMGDLPANKGKIFELESTKDKENPKNKSDEFKGINLKKKDNGYKISTGVSEAVLKDNGETLIDRFEVKGKIYESDFFNGPFLKADGLKYETYFGNWEIVEEGSLVSVLRNTGSFKGERELKFECELTFYALKPYFEIATRIYNTSYENLHIEALTYSFGKDTANAPVPSIELNDEGKIDAPYTRGSADSTGCGDMAGTGSDEEGKYFLTNGIKELPGIEKLFDLENGDVRNTVGRSNYKTGFTIGKNERVEEVITDKLLLMEANEQFAEVNYGTFFADRTDKNGGLCVTVFEAQQNFPKAVLSDNDGIYVMLVPEDVNRIEMLPGMARTQKMLLHFHDADESLKDIDSRSLIYQMKDTPVLDPKVFAKSRVMPDIFVDEKDRNADWEIGLISRADGHGRAYGMLNFGDFPDANYTSQGRGKGKLVWTNNEYDYPHAMYMMFARTGVRRFLDYANRAAEHWMDVDVCHYSADPLRVGGQWEHTMNHCGAGVMVCSHEWVEGLLDCYHFTGEKRALDTAIGIGENVLKLLETPMYQVSGEANARETGWALRTLTALYIETGDKKWTNKCDWIVGHFKEWSQEYGEWIAPYTDNTAIRTGFMISVAIGSLMRYYRVNPSDELKALILSAIDDLKENCLLPTGIFYYKELPGLMRNGNNTLLLEAMATGYELTGNKEYLYAGMKTFLREIKKEEGYSGKKRIEEDALLVGNASTKGFAQSFYPLAYFYKSLINADIKM